jgi:hypothetical protein
MFFFALLLADFWEITLQNSPKLLDVFKTVIPIATTVRIRQKQSIQTIKSPISLISNLIDQKEMPHKIFNLCFVSCLLTNFFLLRRNQPFGASTIFRRD